MSTTALTDAFEDMADEIYLASLGSPVIGTDAEGNLHRWHQRPDVVVAYNGRELVNYQYLREGDSLDKYIQYIRDGIGWEVPNADDRMVEADLSAREAN